ncbi:porin family protein [Myxococcota bacterium]|nr:porin family protein [Myxococcota bacterium]
MRRISRVLVIGWVLMVASALNAEEEKKRVPYVHSGFYVGISGGLSMEQFDDHYSTSEYLTTSGNGILTRTGLSASLFGDPPVAIEPPLDEINASPTLMSLKIQDRVNGMFRFGYRFHPRFALEITFEVVDEFDVDVEEEIPFRNSSQTSPDEPRRVNVQETTTGLKLRPLVATANAKAYLLTGRFQPYFLAGAGPMFASVENTRSGVTENKVVAALRAGGGLDFYITENVIMNTGISYVYPFGSLQDGLDYVSFELLGFQYRFGGPE